MHSRRSREATLWRHGRTRSRPDDGLLARQITELERQIQRDDPALARRFDQRHRARRRNEVVVFALLVLTAVLFAAALSLPSPVAGVGGAAAYLGSFLVDGRYERSLRVDS